MNVCPSTEPTVTTIRRPFQPFKYVSAFSFILFLLVPVYAVASEGMTALLWGSGALYIVFGVIFLWVHFVVLSAEIEAIGFNFPEPDSQ